MKTAYKKSRKPRRARKAKSRVPRSLALSRHQGAHIRETLESYDLDANNPVNMTFCLAQFPRANRLAAQFKFYRAAYVEYRIEPTYNVFAETASTTTPSIPYLYKLMNRTQDNAAKSIAEIQATGAKGHKLTGIHRISYKPNWCTGGLQIYTLAAPPNSGLQSAYTQGLSPKYGWLACPDTVVSSASATPSIIQTSSAWVTSSSVQMSAIQPALTLYNGVTVICDQEYVGGTQAVARVTCTVHWEFKDPNFTQAQPPSVEAVVGPTGTVQV